MTLAMYLGPGHTLGAMSRIGEDEWESWAEFFMTVFIGLGVGNLQNYIVQILKIFSDIDKAQCINFKQLIQS